MASLAIENVLRTTSCQSYTPSKDAKLAEVEEEEFYKRQELGHCRQMNKGEASKGDARVNMIAEFIACMLSAALQGGVHPGQRFVP